MIIGTAGHIDHGKSALVEALTGVHPDRLPEEQRRGMTLDLGFGHLPLGPGMVAGIVDVPGHERFIHTMVAGAGAVDVLLLVVAADRGVQPQTEEHFELCRLLGLSRGVIALTKCDLADAARQAEVREQIARLAQGSFLERAPVVAVSARTGAGLETLRQALAAAAGAVQRRRMDRPCRLPVDRVFQMRGFGTVATGTLLEGTVRRGDELQALPGGARLRARRVQVHGEEVEEARAGERTAVNLAGDAAGALERGGWLAEPGVFEPTRAFDAELRWAAGVAPPAQRAQLRLLLHTAQAMATVHWLEAPYAQLRLSVPLVAVPGDRFILRQLSPARTLGGGVVIEAQAERHRTAERAAAAGLLRALAADGGEAAGGALEPRLQRAGAAGLRLVTLAAALGARAAELRRQLAAAGAALLDHPPAAMEAGAMAALEAEMLAALARFHREQPLEPGASLAQLRLPAAGPDAAAWQALAAERLRGAG
ncbi:MAG: selenocysteine-specific translation elongation factor, partial [Terriglobales bacterium]